MHCSVLKDSKMGTLPHATAFHRIGHFLMEKGILKKQQNLEMKIWGIRPSLIFINICYTFTIFTLHKDYLYFCLIVLFSRFLHQNIISDFHSHANREVENVSVKKILTTEEMDNNSHVVEEKEPWETFRDTIKKVFEDENGNVS